MLRSIMAFSRFDCRRKGGRDLNFGDREWEGGEEGGVVLMDEG